MEIVYQRPFDITVAIAEVDKEEVNFERLVGNSAEGDVPVIGHRLGGPELAAVKGVEG